MRKTLIGLALLLVISASQAATVTLNGATIKYEYDTVTNAAALLIFGTPTIVGDTVRFLPPDFRAESIDGVGEITGTNTDSIDANFIFDRVYSTNQKELTQIQVIEFGDYEITDSGLGAVSPDPNISADLLLSMINNDPSFPFEFTSASDSVNVSGDSGGKQTWQMSASLNPALEFSPVANDVAITIQNTLTAYTNEAGEQAWIQKKISLTAGTGTLVPVPAAVWLFGSALGLLGWSRRKRTV